MVKNKYSDSLYAKLDKIIEQNIYIMDILMRMHDDAQGIADLQQRYNKTRQALREIETSDWFKEHKME